jgi:uncharacterized protein YdeI (BOF family)
VAINSLQSLKTVKGVKFKLSDLIITHKDKKLTEGIDYTVSGNIVTPINKELFKDDDKNGEIELTMKYTYKV